MSAPAHPSPSVASRLAEVADVVEAAHHAEPEAGSSLVLVRGLATPEVELAVTSVPAEGLVARLLGHVTPDRWEAVGVVTSGATRELAPDGASIGPRGDAAQVAVMCHRDGAVASVLRREGAAPVHDLTPPGRPGPVGRVVDALRRSLGMPTPPPDVAVDVVVVQVWLHRVLTLALRGDPLDRGVVDSLRPPAPASWATLREQCADGGWSELACAPPVAAWMDDGMFARWCLAGFPEPVEVLLELWELVPPDAAEHLARAAGAALASPPPPSGRR